MKNVICSLLVFLLIPDFIQANDLKILLPGDWVCTRILDANGNPTVGKFGDSDDYLKFHITRNDISIMQCPLDNFIYNNLPIEIKNDYFELSITKSFGVFEQKYFVQYIDSLELVLSTVDIDNDTIFYYFNNQNKYNGHDNPENLTVDLGHIVIKHILLRSNRYISKHHEYIIKNRYKDYNNVFRSTIKKDLFGENIAKKIKFPKDFPINSITNDLVVEFSFTSNMMEDIKLIKGVREDIDSQILKFLQKNNKNWEGNESNKTIRYRLNFVFMLVEQ